MKSALWSERSSAAMASPPNWVELAACAAVCLLMIFPGAAGTITSALALGGVFAAIRGNPPSRSERRFAWLCLAIPAAYLLNMTLKGWAGNLLDRPMHLAYAVLLAMLIARRGLSMRAFFLATAIASLAAGLIAFGESALAGQERVFGLGGRWNAVPFGNFSLLMGCSALAGGIATRHAGAARWPLVLGLGAFAASTYASMMSGARGGWLALPVLVALATHASAAVRPRHRAAIAATLVAAALCAFALSDTVRERVAAAVEHVTIFIDNPASEESVSNATGIRLAMWRWGLERFKDAPLTGIGYARFPEYRAQAVASGELPLHFASLANLHNEIISSLAFGGLPSAAALFAFWLLGGHFFAARLRRSSDPALRYFATIGFMTIIGTAIFSMTEGLFGTRPGTYGLLIMLALPAGAILHLERRRQRSGSPP